MRQTKDGSPTKRVAVPGIDPVVSGQSLAKNELGRAKVLELLKENYQQVQYHYVQFLAEHLTDCRKSVGGDFDDLMMIAVLGQRLLGARLAVKAGDSGAESRIWMSALRLSDVTGVPRESVRRKLFRLEARGWVTHDPDRGWKLAGSITRASARDDLGSLDERGLERLARLISDLLPYLTSGTGVEQG